MAVGDVIKLPYHPRTLRYGKTPGAVWPPRKKGKCYRGYSGPRRCIIDAWQFWNIDNTGKVVTGIDILLGKKIRESETK